MAELLSSFCSSHPPTSYVLLKVGLAAGNRLPPGEAPQAELLMVTRLPWPARAGKGVRCPCEKLKSLKSSRGSFAKSRRCLFLQPTFSDAEVFNGKLQASWPPRVAILTI